MIPGFVLIVCAAVSAAPNTAGDKGLSEADALVRAMETHPRLPIGFAAAGALMPHHPCKALIATIGTIAAADVPARPAAEDDVGPLQFPLAPPKEGDLLLRYAAAEWSPNPLRPRQEAILFLTGPRRNSGESWGPSLLTREGNTFTLLIENWTDNFQRLRNVPTQSVYAVDLGKLEAGEYVLRILERTMHVDTMRSAPLASCDGVRIATMRFDVRAEPLAGETLPRLSDLGFREAAVPIAWKDRLWQKPLFWVRRSADPKLFPNEPPQIVPLPEPGLRAGVFDVPKWLGLPRTNLHPFPEMAPPATGRGAIAVATGPELNGGEGMTLREIEWNGKHAILRVDLWRDDERRLKNVRARPMLAAPLWRYGASLPAGDYRIEAEWTFLRAPNNRSAYRPEPVADGPQAIEHRALRGRSAVSFRLE